MNPLEIKLNKKKAQLHLAMSYGDFMTQSQQALIGVSQIERKGKALGWSKEQVAAAMLPQIERLRTAAKAAISSAATQGGALGTMQSRADGDLGKMMKWQTVGDDRVCDDCLELGKQPARPYSEWLTSNLPGDGQTICGGRCRCDIVAEEEWENETIKL